MIRSVVVIILVLAVVFCLHGNIRNAYSNGSDSNDVCLSLPEICRNSDNTTNATNTNATNTNATNTNATNTNATNTNANVSEITITAPETAD